MNTRKGLRIKTRMGVEAEVADAFKAFAKWLRDNYEFPIRVPVYLSGKEKVIGIDREAKVSIFFAPFDNNVEPLIRIATGDYRAMIKESGKRNALLNLLYSLALGVVNYQKWLSDNLGLDGYDPEKDAIKLLYKYIDYKKKSSGKTGRRRPM